MTLFLIACLIPNRYQKTIPSDCKSSHSEKGSTKCRMLSPAVVAGERIRISKWIWHFPANFPSSYYFLPKEYHELDVFFLFSDNRPLFKVLVRSPLELLYTFCTHSILWQRVPHVYGQLPDNPTLKSCQTVAPISLTWWPLLFYWRAWWLVPAFPTFPYHLRFCRPLSCPL